MTSCNPAPLPERIDDASQHNDTALPEYEVLRIWVPQELSVPMVREISAEHCVRGGCVRVTQQVRWEVADPRLAELVGGNSILPKCAGETEVYGSWRSFREVQRIRISQHFPIECTIRPAPIRLRVGERVDLWRRLRWPDGAELDFERTTDWRVGNATIARVDGSVLVGISVGTTQLQSYFRWPECVFLGEVTCSTSVEVVPSWLGEDGATADGSL